MNWLKQTFDGSVYHAKYERCKHLGTKPIMRWQVNERMAGTLLEFILPYMIVKKPQAELALAFMQLKRKATRNFKVDPITPQEFSQRDKMVEEMQKLNKSDGRTMIQ